MWSEAQYLWHPGVNHFLEGGRVSPRTNTVRTQATSAQADGGICNTTLKLAIVDTTLLLAGPLDLAT